MSVPSVSIVICTYNRAESLQHTLESLLLLTYPDFEVVIVVGPCTDHTDEVLAEWEGAIKVVRNDQRNLSVSRNLGIVAAAGEIVAFLDDDAIPDGRWLDDLVPAFSADDVAGTGGPVLDHTGAAFQALFNMANRLGDAWIELENRPMAHLEHPDTWVFAYPMGTNALFRRSLLLSAGGFDENYAFYLDETDLCLRLIESGYRVPPLPRGVVCHKFLPSAIRNAERITVDRSDVLMSTAYFAGRHATAFKSEFEVASSYSDLVRWHREDLATHVEAGRAPAAALAKFDQDAFKAWDEAKKRCAEPPATRQASWFAEGSSSYLPFPRKDHPLRRLRLVIVSKDYPPGTVTGVGRANHTTAISLAAAGHLVHVIAESSRDWNTVDLEEGVWVHRVAVRPGGVPPVPHLPDAVWDWSSSVLEEVRRLADIVDIDAIEVPNWDAEGLAVLLDGAWRVVVFIHTPVLAVAEYDHRVDPESPAVTALAAAERIAYAKADLVVAAFRSTVAYVTDLYGVEIPEWRTALIPLALPATPAAPSPENDGVEVLFVGRLEPRKGIDTLLTAIPQVCFAHPDVRFVLAGDDSIVGPDGCTYRESFELANPPDVVNRVRFTGILPDDGVADLIDRCDIFVSPSTFESFGLTNLEAMRAGRPVVSTQVNGVSSVVRDGQDGILVLPGNPVALSAALARLIEDPDLRARMGANGRSSFDFRFSAALLAERRAKAVQAMLEGKPYELGIQPAVVESQEVHPLTAVAAQRQKSLLQSLRCPSCSGDLETVAVVRTSDGRVKTGVVWCPVCDATVGRVSCFQVNLVQRDLQGTTAHLEEERVVGELGERRVAPGDQRVVGFGWTAYPHSWISGTPGARLVLRVPCTDIRIRVVDHDLGGLLRVRVDGRDVVRLDTYTAPGSLNRIVDVACDLEMAVHELELVVDEVKAPSGQVVVQEIVLLGPLGGYASAPFSAVAPFARGNPYSDRIRAYLDKSDLKQLTLECGGGDRRPERANHINMEYLPYEGADLRADVHRLPFEDDTFGMVLNQAVLEHVANPFDAVREMVRVCKPGGLILTEVAFMQPLHGVPSHYFNMTEWGVHELFAGSCSIVESDWFGEVSFTMNWLLDASGVTTRISSAEREEWRLRLSKLDSLIDHESLKPVASGIWVVAQKHGPVYPEREPKD